MTTQLDEPIDISQTREAVPAVELPFDFDRIVSTWKKYNIFEVPLHVRAGDGTVYDDGKLKGLFRKERKKRQDVFLLNKIVNRKYIVLPNEECDLIVGNTIDRIGKKYGLKLYKTHHAYNGDAKYWEIRSNKQYVIEGSHRAGDKVQLGIIVRNSVGCNVSFGADVFTFRLVCQNGAISKGKDLLSLKIPHYGKDSLKFMYESLSRRIEDLFFEGTELIRDYERAARLKIRQEAAELLVKKVSHKYLPDYIDIDSENQKVTLKHTNNSFWQLFNYVTKEVWHNNAISFLTKADITNVMHYVMKNEIAVTAK